MIFEFHIPTEPLLAQCVQSITYVEGYTPSHSIERLLPDGSCNLIIELGDYPQFLYDNDELGKKRTCKHAWLSGMQSGFITISSGVQTAMMIISFKPFGLYPLTQVPINEFNDQVVDADLVFGAGVISEFRELLMAAPDALSKIGVAERWLRNRMTEPERLQFEVVRFAVDQIGVNPTRIALTNLVQRVGYSHQQLIKIFKKHAGLTPKKYQRVARFNRVLSDLQQTRDIDWQQVSYDCGFFDQAHFIKEFRHFSGLSPSEYAAQAVEYPNYVPVG